MKLRISKWGNSLAVRLPTDYTRAAGVREGDSVDAHISPTGNITLTPDRRFDKASFLKKIQKLRGGIPLTSATVEEMRAKDRY